LCSPGGLCAMAQAIHDAEKHPATKRDHDVPVAADRLLGMGPGGDTDLEYRRCEIRLAHVSAMHERALIGRLARSGGDGASFEPQKLTAWPDEALGLGSCWASRRGARSFSHLAHDPSRRGAYSRAADLV